MASANTGTDPAINILLLGETGVGKSTFINSFVNYMQFTDIEDAIEGDGACLIPTKFTIPDENFEIRTVEVGKDDNEDNRTGQSATQSTKCYVFPTITGDLIRLIDTPGIGDVRGLGQDKINFENILSFISMYEQIHAVCFLLKPNVTRLNVYFNFCIMHLLSRLHKSATQNIVFLFTNTRSTFYRPGETLSILRKVLDGVESETKVHIPCGKDNIFCMDNEAFQFQVAIKNNIAFGERERTEFSASWTTSAECCWRFLEYVQLLTPHKTRDTLSVNDARRVILDLSKPLADVASMIDDNVTILNRQKEQVAKINATVEDLRGRLQVTCVNLRQIGLTHPVTVCTAAPCSEIYTVAGLKKYHYKQRCHNPCYLRNVPSEIRGSPELKYCEAMKNGMCTVCKHQCNFQTHMHIYYDTELYEDTLQDQSVQEMINSNNDAVKQKQQHMLKLESLCKQYEYEQKIITVVTAQFALFLRDNSLIVYNDFYLDYIDYLTEREKALGKNSDKSIIAKLEKQKKEYLQEKSILDRARNNLNGESSLITTQDINKCVMELYSLEYTGSLIKELHQRQQTCRMSAHGLHKEYRHKSPIKRVWNKMTNMYQAITAVNQDTNIEPESPAEVTRDDKKAVVPAGFDFLLKM